MTLVQQQSKFSQDVAKLLQFIVSQGNYVTLGEAWRTAEQAQIYAKEHKGILDSLHCQRLAIDLNLYSSAGLYLTEPHDYQKAGEYWESLDPQNRWGGFFVSKYGGHLVDSDHFERKSE